MIQAPRRTYPKGSEQISAPPEDSSTPSLVATATTKEMPESPASADSHSPSHRLRRGGVLGLRRVKGPSMLPAYRDGAVILFSSLIRPRVGSVVVAILASEEVIKRVRSITEAGRFYLVGDNHAQSVDSREYGPVKRSDIQGVVLKLRKR